MRSCWLRILPPPRSIAMLINPKIEQHLVRWRAECSLVRAIGIGVWGSGFFKSRKMTSDPTNVVIIGGGPAGSALGCYLSKAGIKNTIFEAANHPRPHVGESMVMSSVRVFDEIGFLPVLEREGFPRKYGASWHPPVAKGEADISFDEFPQDNLTAIHLSCRSSEVRSSRC